MSDLTPEERDTVRRELAEQVIDTAGEWMRLSHFLQSEREPNGIQVRIRYEDPLHVPEDGVDAEIFVSLSETGYGAEFGRYLISVKVEALPDLPPEGPETDPALAFESEELHWYPRTYLDVRVGDTIRHTPTAPPAIVKTCSIEQRHVKDGGIGKHWDDVAVEHMLTRVRLDYEGNPNPDRILDIPSNLPVEIELTEAEFKAIETFGWSDRQGVETT